MAISFIGLGLFLLTTGTDPSPGASLSSSAEPPASTTRDIQRRIATSLSGATISLPPTKIHGSLRIDKPLTIRGAGQGSTIIQSKGEKPVLIISAPEKSTIHVEDITFTSAQRTSRHRGVGIMLSGPGTIKFTNVDLSRTITGYCIGSAIQARSPLELQMDHVQIRAHNCYVAGAITIKSGMDVTIRNSSIEGNTGNLAGAILLTGGKLRIENTQFRANSFSRGTAGQALIVASAEPTELTLVAVEFLEHTGPPIAFDSDTAPTVRFSKMSWPQVPQPSFVRKLGED
ncbi:MAG: right-handed parallel beta-helix repeat-containing protein [Myxococcales bacterium]|nr:right-handed parallel beta-helix repeat-containing protein [Myxococcales bacterium]